jgi:hypothetical protein
MADKVFGSEIHDQFYARGDLLRPNFGHWDYCDPVANVILDLVEAQTKLADAISDYANFGGSKAAIRTAMQQRFGAAKKLMPAIDEHETWF